MLAWRWISLCAAAANAFVVPAGPRRPTLRSPPAAAVADYSFMLPASTAVATCCQLCGIGGAALFSPIFLLVRVRRPLSLRWRGVRKHRRAQVFPLLGPDYPLDSAAAAVASALLTETFGFASGLVGYARRDLVDWAVAREILAVSVPGALVGAVCAPSLAGDAQLLRAVYALLMLSLATDLARRDRAAPPAGDKLADGAATAGGAFLTGLLGVGVGEVVLPQLSRDRPLPQAAGTSVAVVAGTAAAAAVTQVAELDATQVPWELVRYTIPGVILGGQIAPRLAGRLDDRQIERAAAALFAVVGAAFALKAATG